MAIIPDINRLITNSHSTTYGLSTDTIMRSVAAILMELLRVLEITMKLIFINETKSNDIEPIFRALMRE